ncbi:DUF6982 domain-containing protein [uncultured Paludibaculum sp.]|uniref:DUF6982 domain-containing protein n=1 Tax=uncultured Paludibaculum sp. TaxID=1765020 RepID=UPI002AABA565|nr:hypothetical protein [uncultured Paludibaculum sp.]
MSGTTAKKVILERFDRERVRGFVHPQTYLQAAGVEILSPDGSVALIPYAQVKAVSFVRDLEGNGVLAERREFLARPKTAGLWVELQFRDGDLLEGVLANNLLLLEPQGYALSPPEAGGNAQRVFVPRQALSQLTVLGIVGGKRKKAGREAEPQQIRLFAEE